MCIQQHLHTNRSSLFDIHTQAKFNVLCYIPGNISPQVLFSLHTGNKSKFQRHLAPSELFAVGYAKIRDPQKY